MHGAFGGLKLPKTPNGRLVVRWTWEAIRNLFLGACLTLSVKNPTQKKQIFSMVVSGSRKRW